MSVEAQGSHDDDWVVVGVLEANRMPLVSVALGGGNRTVLTNNWLLDRFWCHIRTIQNWVILAPEGDNSDILVRVCLTITSALVFLDPELDASLLKALVAQASRVSSVVCLLIGEDAKRLAVLSSSAEVVLLELVVQVVLDVNIKEGVGIDVADAVLDGDPVKSFRNM